MKFHQLTLLKWVRTIIFLQYLFLYFQGYILTSLGDESFLPNNITPGIIHMTSIIIRGSTVNRSVPNILTGLDIAINFSESLQQYALDIVFRLSLKPLYHARQRLDYIFVSPMYKAHQITPYILCFVALQ